MKCAKSIEGDEINLDRIQFILESTSLSSEHMMVETSTYPGGNLNIWENFLGQIEQNAGHWAASITCMHHIPQLVKEGLGNLFARLDIDELEQENENGLCDQSLLVSLVISHRNCSTIQLLWADILSCGNCGPFLLPPNHHGEEVDHVDHGDDNEKLCRVG